MNRALLRPKWMFLIPSSVVTITRRWFINWLLRIGQMLVKVRELKKIARLSGTLLKSLSVKKEQVMPVRV